MSSTSALLLMLTFMALAVLMFTIGVQHDTGTFDTICLGDAGFTGNSNVRQTQAQTYTVSRTRVNIKTMAIGVCRRELALISISTRYNRNIAATDSHVTRTSAGYDYCETRNATLASTASMMIALLMLTSMPLAVLMFTFNTIPAPSKPSASVALVSQVTNITLVLSTWAFSVILAMLVPASVMFVLLLTSLT